MGVAEHLAEARAIAERLHPQRELGVNYIRDAINHLADAIEELRSADLPGQQNAPRVEAVECPKCPGVVTCSSCNVLRTRVVGSADSAAATGGAR